MTKKLQKDIFEDEIDGNAFAIMGTFRRQAKKEGWTDEEIEVVMTEAKSNDYNHLLQTLMGAIA